MGALAVVVILTPASIGAGGYMTVMQAMAKITAWIIGPSMVLTVIAGAPRPSPRTRPFKTPAGSG